MNKVIVLLVIVSMPAMVNAEKECVILLHGLARSSHSMNKMEAELARNGYDVVNYDYPSTKYDIPALAKEHLPLAISKCAEKTSISFVTHSMGAIILRQYLEENTMPALNRVVMLGPPNQGSQVVDNLKNVPGFKLINGPAGAQLGTRENDIPAKLGPAKGEVGIIAGRKSINLILSLYLPNPDDGKVSVENTKLEGMEDHLTVDVSHPFLMKDKEVIRQVLWFLAEGQFNRAR